MSSIADHQSAAASEVQAAGTFADFGLRPDILRGLEDMGYTVPTPVQALAIPKVMAGGDWVVQAKTGSGKTLAFGLPALQDLDPMSPDVQVLVICPTRELAIQVADEIKRASAHVGVITTAVYGGSKMDPQIEALRWTSIVVGTPGRLRDHLERGTLRLDGCRTAILDEADEMLDMGFKKDLEFILGAIANPSRRTLLFSATFPPAIEGIARRYMRDAQKVSVSSGLTTPVSIAHRFVRVASADGRVEALAQLLAKEEPDLGIIFCKTKLETSWLARKLSHKGFRVGFMNGDISQDQRLATLGKFKRGELNLLVATDVAARGLDIQGVSHVINYSVPDSTETYVHRSGRTGRAGRTGICYTLVTPDAADDFTRIQKDLARNQAKAAPTAPVAKPVPAPRPKASEAQPAPALLPKTPEAQPAEPAAPVSAERIVPVKPLFTADRLHAQASPDWETYRPLARQLMDHADPEQIVAMLLSLHEEAKAAHAAHVTPFRPRKRAVR